MVTYYEILEVKKTATPEEIKKSYKELAKVWHPDQHLDDKRFVEKKFQQITRAYDTLIDAESRKKYDRDVMAPLEAEKQRETEMANYRAYFDNIIKQGGDPYAPGVFANAPPPPEGYYYYDQAPQQQPTGPPGFFCGGYDSTEDSNEKSDSDFEPYIKTPDRGKDIEVEVDCTMDELYTGITKKITIMRMLQGKKKVYLDMDVKIPAGSFNGESIDIIGEGHVTDERGIVAHRPGTLYVRVNEMPHFLYKRKFNDLDLTLHITPKQAIKGFTKKVRTIDGQTHNVKFPKLIRSDFKYVLKGKGMLNHYNHRGDLHIFFVVHFTDKYEKTKKMMNKNRY